METDFSASEQKLALAGSFFNAEFIRNLFTMVGLIVRMLKHTSFYACFCFVFLPVFFPALFLV